MLLWMCKNLKDRDAVLEILKFNLEKAQARMKRFSNKKRTDVQFKVGDYICEIAAISSTLSAVEAKSKAVSEEF